MKVLVAEDDSDLLEVIAYGLRRERFDVVVATDGQQALQRWYADRPDVAVLAVRLRRLNGFEVCQQIRQSATTPVILLSSEACHEDAAQGRRLGAGDCLAKPFSVRHLAQRIRTVHFQAA